MSRHALILAGGKGSRLRPFTFAIPKPLVPIGDLPIIEILIRQLAAFGFERISISVGYLAALIEAYCGDGDRWGVPIDYVYETEPLGTIGGLAHIGELSDDRLLVVNGDTLTTMDFGAAYDAHDVSDALTIHAFRREVEISFGVLESDERGVLTGYREKPQLEYQVSMGVNVISAWTIDKYLDGGRLDLPDLAAALLAANEQIRVVETDDFWLDLGRFDDLEAGSAAFLEDPQRFLPS